MDRIIRTAIIGLGNSAKNFHIPFLEVSPHYHLKTIVKRTAPTEEMRNRYAGTYITCDVEDAMQDEDIDLVIITTPTATHYSLCRMALESGKHVIVEKPITATYEEAMELDRIAKEEHCVLSVYHNRRWDGDFLTVKRLMEEEMLGKRLSYESRFDRYRKELRPQAWREQALPGSGILYDIGSHLIDQALGLFGWPQWVKADVRAERGGAVDDAFDLVLGYPDIEVTLHAGMLVHDPTPRFTVKGERAAYIKYGLDPQESVLKEGILPSCEDWGRESEDRWGILTSSKGEQNIETEAGDYMAYYEGMYKAIMHGSQTMVTAQEAAAVIHIIELAMLSSERGERVEAE